MNQDEYHATLERVANEIPGFLAAAFVDSETGMPLASVSRNAGFDIEVASAYNSEMVRAKLKTISALGIHADLEDMLITLSDQLHLVKMAGNSVFIYVAVSRQSTNLAILRRGVAMNLRSAP